ncbi:MAG: hypothetical protein ACRCXY_04250 [Fusobacteriaceae bacterium]
MKFDKYYRLQRIKERKKSMDELLEIIKFPKELITVQIYYYLEKIMFESKVKYFSGFSYRNEYNGKMKYHLAKMDKNFSMAPLFTEVHLERKGKKAHEYASLIEIGEIGNLLFCELQLKNQIEKNIWLEKNYKKNFVNEVIRIFYGGCIKGDSPLRFDVFFHLPSLVDKIGNVTDKTVSYESYIERLEHSLEEYTSLYNSILNFDIFSYSFDDSYDSIIRLFKILSNGIYNLILSIDKEKLKNLDIVLDKIISSESIVKDMACKNSEDNLYMYLYMYEKEVKNKNDIELYDNLIKDDTLCNYLKKINEIPSTVFRTNFNIETEFKIEKLNKLELYNWLIPDKTASKYSNFCRSIKNLEDFLIFLNKIGILHTSRISLKHYALLFNEFIMTDKKMGEKSTNKVVKDIGRWKKISQEEGVYLYAKLEKVNYIYRHGYEDYEHYAEFNKKLLKILEKEAYNRHANTLILAMKEMIQIAKDALKNRDCKLIFMDFSDEEVKINLENPYTNK